MAGRNPTALRDPRRLQAPTCGARSDTDATVPGGPPSPVTRSSSATASPHADPVPHDLRRLEQRAVEPFVEGADPQGTADHPLRLLAPAEEQGVLGPLQRRVDHHRLDLGLGALQDRPVGEGESIKESPAHQTERLLPRGRIGICGGPGESVHVRAARCRPAAAVARCAAGAPPRFPLAPARAGPPRPWSGAWRGPHTGRPTGPPPTRRCALRAGGTPGRPRAPGRTPGKRPGRLLGSRSDRGPRPRSPARTAALRGRS